MLIYVLTLALTVVFNMGTAVAQIGRSLVRSQLVSVDFSLPYNPSDRTMALGSTQPLTEMSTRRIFLRVKAVGA